MTNQQQQKLFEYFQQEHNIMLLDVDFNEIDHILKSNEDTETDITEEEIDNLKIHTRDENLIELITKYQQIRLDKDESYKYDPKELDSLRNEIVKHIKK